MDQYVVLCDCDPAGQPNDVGYIDDNRENGGGLEIEAWPPQPTGVRVAQTRAGHRRGPQELKCRRCGLRAALSDTTVAEIIALIVRPSPDSGKSLRDHWGKTLIPFEEYVDDRGRSAEIAAEMSDDRDQWLPSDVPTVTRYAQLYTIPFIELRRMVSERDKRRD
jgi:hypothetical protein